MSDRYDIVIVGGGAAGFTAGIYAARDRCRALLVERFSPGGQVLNCEHIENFPGFPDGVAGYTLGPLMQQQATAHGLELQMTEVDYPGLTANTGFLKGLVPLDADGHVITDLSMRTSVPGVLAAGDVRHASARQLVSSAGDGATAALAAIRYLRTSRWDA